VKQVNVLPTFTKLLIEPCWYIFSLMRH